jgi:hypothetical protein
VANQSHLTNISYHTENSRILPKGLGRTKHSIMQIQITHSRQMALLSLLMNEERTLDIGLPEISGFVYVI